MTDEVALLNQSWKEVTYRKGRMGVYGGKSERPSQITGSSLFMRPDYSMIFQNTRATG